MGEGTPLESNVIQWAGVILRNLDLTWDDLRGRDVLDMGSGSSELAEAATVYAPTARIFSHDTARKENWAGLPFQAKGRLVQADVEALPFADGSFDLVVAHGSVDAQQTYDAIRTLREGGQMRIYPLGGQLLEFWDISYYLEQEKGWNQDRITAYLEDLSGRFDDVDGSIPTEFIHIREEALDTLSPGQKLEVIDMMAERYRQVTGIPFEYSVVDPMARQPEGILIYTKE
jgi:hypothetical protein